jgi:hypothetical protein
VAETLEFIRQVFGEENVKSKLTEAKKKARQVKSKIKSLLVIFFDIKGIVHRKFILAGQTVNSLYYCDVL